MKIRNNNMEETEINLAELMAGGEQYWPTETVTYFGPESRSIYLVGEVYEKSSTGIISQLMQLTAESDTEPIALWLNTPGGDLQDALAIYDIMRSVVTPIYTIGVGQVSSAGVLIMQGGDLRLCTPSTEFFYHQAITGGSYVDSEKSLLDKSNTYIRVNKRMNTIIKERSKLNQKAWNAEFEGKTSFSFDAAKAKELKLIDDIIQYAKPKPVKLAWPILPPTPPKKK